MTNRVMSMTDEEWETMLMALSFAEAETGHDDLEVRYRELRIKVKAAGRYEGRTGAAIAGTAGVERLRDVLEVGKVLREGAENGGSDE